MRCRRRKLKNKRNANISHKADLLKASFVRNFINTSQGQFDFDLPRTKLNKSKISKNNISMTNRWTDGLMD